MTNAIQQFVWSGLPKALGAFQRLLAAAQADYYVAEIQKNQSLNPVPNLKLLLLHKLFI